MHRSPLVFTDSTNPSAKRAACSTSESVTFNRFAPENASEIQIALHHDLQPLTPAQSKRYYEVENEIQFHFLHSARRATIILTIRSAFHPCHWNCVFCRQRFSSRNLFHHLLT